MSEPRVLRVRDTLQLRHVGWAGTLADVQAELEGAVSVEEIEEGVVAITFESAEAAEEAFGAVFCDNVLGSDTWPDETEYGGDDMDRLAADAG